MTAVQPEIETRAATKPLRLPTFREQYWLLVALLALLAYAPSLGAGFVSDDLVLLYQARSTGFEPQVFIPPQNFFLYRPLGSLLIWQLGWALWGHNPLPFHLISLALHASVSLLLGLWLARSTARPWLGWLAGALFAVMPLHLEAVAWIAAQWDLLSMFFVMLSLYLFTGWWLRDRAVAREERSTEDDRSPAPEVGSRRVSTSFVPYAFAVLLYGAAIFTKESLLAFLPVFGVAAWLASRRMSRVAWLRLALALVPFAGMLALNVGIRLVRWGHLGGYARTRAEFLDLLPVFWNHLSDFARVLLSPINSMVLGTPISQTVGAISALALLAGLVLYGRQVWRVLLAAGVWMLAAAAPVISLTIKMDDLQQNRILYTIAAGYMIAVAALIYAWATSQGGRRWAPAAVGVLLAVGTLTCWVQLQPWVAAGSMVESIDRDLDKLIPASRANEQQVWYVQNLPDNHKGAYVYRLGLGATRSLTGKAPRVEPVADARTAPLDTAQGDAFAVGFGYTGESWDYDLDYLAGITQDANPPAAGQGADVQDVWDFRSCESNAAGAWQVEAGEVRCEAGRGLVLHADANGKATISSTPIFEGEAGRHGRYVRLRVNARYSPGAGQVASRLRGYGGIPLIVPADTDQSSTPPPNRSRADVPLRPDGIEHTYWLTLPFQRISGQSGYPLSVELDPGTGQGEVDIQWIAVDLVTDLMK